MISAVKFISVYLWLFALLRLGSAQHISNNSETNDVHASISGSLPQSPTAIPVASKVSTYIRHRRASSTSLCFTPPQPANGEYKLDKYFCKDNVEDCSISEGQGLEPGSQLVYACNSGFRANGKSDVFCRARGTWSPIPSCVEVKCESLNSASTTVSCMHSGKWINCDSSVPPETKAEVDCRPGYKRDTDVLSTRSGVVECNINGKWEPNPIKCVPACGQLITPQKPLALGATPAKIGDFPWHASLFVEKNLPTGKTKDFICGGTIIRANLVLTAAHCVYHESTETTTDPAKLFVITGNIFRDYDYMYHNPEIVRKAAVKNVYMYCNYYGLKGNYASDIALLELLQPFEYSNILSPACLDDSVYNDQFLEPGKLGKVAGFGRTASSPSSAVLQTLTLPYRSYSQCSISYNAEKNQAFISSDKFCAGYNNGSAVCEGDSGGGLVFKKGDLWYVMGIVSVGLGVDTHSGERTCDKHSYSLYTRVSTYINWIRRVMFFLESKQALPPCNPYTKLSNVAATKPTATESMVTRRPETTPSPAAAVTHWWDDLTSPATNSPPIPVSSCLAPPQPNNGNRKLHKNSCENGRDCNIPEGAPLEPGSQLVYSCFGEFTLNGPTDVYCRPGGSWTTIPTCTGELSDGRGEIARKKCAEYANSIESITHCPQRYHMIYFFTDMETIIYSTGKMPADRMEFPHMAAVGYNSSDVTISWHCGGTLISESFVLTAAYCIRSSARDQVMWVRLGDVNLTRSDDGAMPEQRRVIEKIPHPDYRRTLKINNIALLRLETPVSFNRWIIPACLHTSPTVEAEEATATGWGALDFVSDERPHNLMKVVVPLVDWKTCNATYSPGPDLPNGVIKQQSICAGRKGRDTCQSDAGGPLVISRRLERCMYDVVGVVNYGKLCGFVPSVYARVYYYLPWIERTVWGGNTR